jgi:hypothetical protein
MAREIGSNEKAFSDEGELEEEDDIEPLPTAPA